VLEGRLCLSSAAPTWESLGPAPGNDLYQNIIDTQYVDPPQLTGAVQTLATFQTADGSTGAYAGGALGGIWRTDDLFASPPQWTTSTDAMPSLAIDSVAVSPLDPTGNTAFAGTGGTSNGNFTDSLDDGDLLANAASLDVGLYRTIDGGQTWDSMSPPGSPLYGKFISKVVPSDLGTALNTQTVLVGTDHGLYDSTDGGATFTESDFTSKVLDVIEDPLNSVNQTQIFYLLADGSDSGTQGAFVSVDGGANWTAINTGTLGPLTGEFDGAGRLAATVVDNQTLLALTFEDSPDLNTYGILETTVTDDTSGSSSAVTGVTTDWSTYFTFATDLEGGYANNLGLAIDPTDPSIFYTTGLAENRTFRIAPPSGGGAPTAQELTHEDGDHPSLYDGRSLTFVTDPQGDPELLLTSDSGIYGLPNPELPTSLPQWTPMTGNLSAAEMYSVSAMATAAGQLYVAGGMQDTANAQALVTPDGSTTWVVGNSGDGDGTSFDPAAQMLYTTSDYLGGLEVDYVSNGAQSAVTFSGFAFDDGPGNAADDPYTNFIEVSQVPATGTAPMPVAMSEFGLYEAVPTSLTSGNVDMVMVKAPADNEAQYTALAYGGMNPVTGQPDPYILYAAREDGTLWYDDTDPQDPQAPDSATRLTGWTHGSILSLALDPGDDQDVFAVTKDALYESNDGGTSWSEYATQPPAALGPFLSVGIVPTQIGGQAVNLIVVGGLGGFDVLADGGPSGQSWYAAGANLPNIWGSSIAYQPQLDDLVVGTFGRGAWLLTDASQALLYPWAGQATIQFSPPAAPQSGAALTLSAEVQPMLAGASQPGGTIAFSAETPGGLVSLGAAPVADGEAQLPIPGGVPFGTEALVAAYSGDGTYAAAQSQATVAVAPASTSVALNGPGSAFAGGAIVLWAAVTGTPGTGSPTSGTVEFEDNGTPIGSAPLDAEGVASLGVATLAVGTHELTAAYLATAGSPYASGQTAGPLTVQVAAAPTDPPGPTPPVATATTLVVERVRGRGPRRLEFRTSVESSLTSPPVGTMLLLFRGRPVASSQLGSSDQATFIFPASLVARKAVMGQFQGGTSGTLTMLGSESQPFFRGSGGIARKDQVEETRGQHPKIGIGSRAL
jgi:hypothetical protein